MCLEKPGLNLVIIFVKLVVLYISIQTNKNRSLVERKCIFFQFWFLFVNLFYKRSLDKKIIRYKKVIIPSWGQHSKNIVLQIVCKLAYIVRC